MRTKKENINQKTKIILKTGRNENNFNKFINQHRNLNRS